MTTLNVTRPPGYSALRKHSEPAAEHEASDILGPGAARVLTDQIKVGVESVWELVKQAYTQRAWSALGYAGWDDYCTSEFGASRLRIPREERAEVVASLRESKLSIRAIASATGLGRGTIGRELAHVPNGTPDAEPINAEIDEDDVDVDAETIDAEVVDEQFAADQSVAPGVTTFPDNVIGIDGKRYRRENPANPDTPRRRPITDQASNLGLELSRMNKAFAKLLDDDRFERNLDAIGSRLRHEVAECQKLMARMDAKINKQPAQPDANLAPLSDLRQHITDTDCAPT